MDRRSIALALLVAGLVIALSPAPLAASSPESETGLINAADPPDLFLIHSGDVIGYIDPCG
jgi:hypothetical protein